MKKIITFVLIVLIFVAPSSAQEAVEVQISSEKVEAACSTDPALPDALFRCAVRVEEFGNPISVSAVDPDNNTVLPTVLETGIPATDDSSIVFLIDRSNPARAPAVKNIIDDFKEITKQKGQNQKISVMSFADKLTVHNQFSNDLDTIIAALDDVKASGLSTELFRLTGEAVKLLAQQDSKNKVLMLASDGKAEDQVYMSPAVVEPSIKSGIRIVGLGYIKREQETPDVQVLRKLAEESGGAFYLAPPGQRLPSEDIEGLLQGVSTTTNFQVKVVPGVTVQSAAIRLEFKSAEVVSFKVVVPEATVVADTANSAENNPQSNDSFVDRATDYLQSTTGIIILILVVSVLLGLILFLVKRTGKPKSETDEVHSDYFPVAPEHEEQVNVAVEAEISSEDNPPATAIEPPSTPVTPAPTDPSKQVYAVLEFANPQIGEYEMTDNEVKIGRHSSDDVFCSDSHVSRQHVLISRNPRGRFEILNRQSDREVPNPIYVNNNEIVSSELNDEDVVRIGNGSTVFTFSIR